MSAWQEGPGVVTLPDGRRVRGRGLRAEMPAGPAPEFGVYLASNDPGPFRWTYRWVECRDFRTPVDRDEALAALSEAFRRAETERVEVACGGGVGRTGLGLAALAVLSGVAPGDAVHWVRTHYHRRAVETPWQRLWVRRLPRPRS
ncbi:MAG: protein phosphatase [Aquihabitans sp.]